MLRQALSKVRRVISDGQAEHPVLSVSRDALQLNPAADCATDVALFTRLAAVEATGKPSTDHLEQAVGLYRGELLEGFSLADCKAFDRWLTLKRQDFALFERRALERLAVHYEAAGAFERAQACAHRRHKSSSRAVEKLASGNGAAPSPVSSRHSPFSAPHHDL